MNCLLEERLKRGNAFAIAKAVLAAIRDESDTRFA
jgi:hypothetical protein